MLLGIVAGWLLLRQLSAQGSQEASRIVKMFVGCLAVLFVLLELGRRRMARRLAADDAHQPWRPTLWSTAPFGLTAGISTMIAHSAGAITTIYLLAQRLDRRTFVGTSGRYYFLFNSLKVPFFLHLGYIHASTLGRSLWLAPLAPLGVWLGSELNRRITGNAFSIAIYILLVLSGLYLVASNLGAPGG